MVVIKKAVSSYYNCYYVVCISNMLKSGGYLLRWWDIANRIKKQ